MRRLLPVAWVACLAVMAWQLSPVAVRPVPRAFEAVGVSAVKPPDFDRISAVLAKRAPGLGLSLREHIARAIVEESNRAGFDPLLVLAVISVESEFQSNAVSHMGARGLMQVRPTTLYFVAEKEGLKLSRAEIDADPSLNVRLGVRYLKTMRDQFWGNMDLALMAYNAGPTRLHLSLKARNTEPFQGYVRAVQRNYATLKRSLGERGDWALASRETSGASQR